MTILDPFRDGLDKLAAEHRLRRLIPRAGIDFASNDYLGLAGSGLLTEFAQNALARGVPVGAGGSRLLRGNHDEHEALETDAAAFFGAEAALFFANGFAANSAIFGNLPTRHDLIAHDALIHASVHDGMRLGFAATASTAHNDPDAMDAAIASWRAKGGKGTPWISVESLYSMDGDLAPLDAYAAIADRHDAFLVIDEAHAAGVFGLAGRGAAHGLAGRDNVIRLVTCGKALGAEGALLLGPRAIVDTLVNKGRGFIFSTAPSPLVAATLRDVLRLLETDKGARQAALQSRVTTAERDLGVASGSQILPIIVGEDGETMRIANMLQARGFDVRGIRPPTVPKGTSRLRVSVTLNATDADIAALGAALKEIRQ